MKAIIIGGGSIGKRHESNLKKLNVFTRIVDIDEIHDIDNILNEKYDIGLVCTPNINHIEYCIKLAQHDIHIFCEKPFYTNNVNVDELLNLVNSKNLINMVGCNLRFTPEVQQIDSTSKYINVYFGYNLKKWRPLSDHIKSYSANKELGGGVLLDVIHELDYLYYKFGTIKYISYIKNKISNITVDTEDLVIGRIEFMNGTIADFSLNYLSNDYQRYYDILTTEDSLNRIHFNFNDNNQMYMDEIVYFLNNVKNKIPCMNNFNEANNLLKHLI